MCNVVAFGVLTRTRYEFTHRNAFQRDTVFIHPWS
jgi:hypothetical protein